MNCSTGILRVMVIVWVVPFKAWSWSICKSELVVSHFIKMHLVSAGVASGLDGLGALAGFVLPFALPNIRNGFKFDNLERGLLTGMASTVSGQQHSGSGGMEITPKLTIDRLFFEHMQFPFF